MAAVTLQKAVINIQPCCYGSYLKILAYFILRPGRVFEGDLNVKVIRLISLIVLSASAISHGANYGTYDEHAPEGAKRYTDNDWNVTFVRSCGALKSAPYFDFVEEGGDKFARFALSVKDTAGQCEADIKVSRARAEIRTIERMTLGKSYRFGALVRFPNGMAGDAIFMQVHANKPDCKNRPPVKLRLMDNMQTLALEALGKSTEVYVQGEFGPQWTRVDIILHNLGKSGAVDILINDKAVIKSVATSIEKACTRPWGKIGLFALNEKSSLRTSDTAIVDYDNVILEEFR